MNFFDYFASVLEQISNLWRMNVPDLVNDMNKLLKMNIQQLMAISLSCFLSPNKKTADDGIKLLKKSLQDYHLMGKVQIFPDYLQHLLIYVVKNNQDFKVFPQNLHIFL